MQRRLYIDRYIPAKIPTILCVKPKKKMREKKKHGTRISDGAEEKFLSQTITLKKLYISQNLPSVFHLACVNIDI